MAKFKFKLEAVLKQRQALEDVAQRELAKVMRQRMIMHDQLRTMQNTIVSSKRDLTDGLMGQVDMTSVGQFARYSVQVRQRAHGIVAQLANVERLVEAARLKLIEASRDRKVIDRLREKHYNKWLLEQQRREAAELDEIGTGQYAHRMMAETS